jgi:hypothetical protein
MIETSATVAKLFDAFHKAQGEMSGVLKDKANAHFKTRYATLESVMNTARPVLNAHGLSWTQAPGAVVDGRLTITTQIMHVSGEWMRSTFHMAVAKQDPQGIGSACTYGLRYSLMAVLGLPPTDDDDGESAMDRAPSSLGAAATERKSAYRARKDGDWDKYLAAIKQCNTVDMLKSWGTSHRQEIAALPDQWREHLSEAYADRMDELRNVLAAG